MGSNSPTERGNFERGKRGRSIVKYGTDSAVSCANMAQLIEMLFGLWARLGPRNHVRCRSRSPMGSSNFKGGGAARCKV